MNKAQKDQFNAVVKDLLTKGDTPDQAKAIAAGVVNKHKKKKSGLQAAAARRLAKSGGK